MIFRIYLSLFLIIFSSISYAENTSLIKQTDSNWTNPSGQPQHPLVKGTQGASGKYRYGNSEATVANNPDSSTPADLANNHNQSSQVAGGSTSIYIRSSCLQGERLALSSEISQKAPDLLTNIPWRYVQAADGDYAVDPGSLDIICKDIYSDGGGCAQKEFFQNNIFSYYFSMDFLTGYTLFFCGVTPNPTSDDVINVLNNSCNGDGSLYSTIGQMPIYGRSAWIYLQAQSYIGEPDAVNKLITFAKELDPINYDTPVSVTKSKVSINDLINFNEAMYSYNNLCPADNFNPGCGSYPHLPDYQPSFLALEDIGQACTVKN
jgi:hypothetical protein